MQSELSHFPSTIAKINQIRNVCLAAIKNQKKQYIHPPLHCYVQSGFWKPVGPITHGPQADSGMFKRAKTGREY
jgi:hypothetical protein